MLKSWTLVQRLHGPLGAFPVKPHTYIGPPQVVTSLRNQVSEIVTSCLPQNQVVKVSLYHVMSEDRISPSRTPLTTGLWGNVWCVGGRRVSPILSKDRRRWLATPSHRKCHTQ